MSHDAASIGTLLQTGLNGHDDARALIRLIQCSLCSHPLRTPVTLPCGNSLCRACLPPPHERENVSYPDILSRRLAITCPFPNCPYPVHPLDDCSVNVVLLKIMESIGEEVTRFLTTAGDKQTSVEETLLWKEEADDTTLPAPDQIEKGHSRSLPGGRLIATYTFAEMSELHYTSDVKYDDPPEGAEESVVLDNQVLERIKEASHKELDCHVCYNLILDPVTTPCGHTFCRKCLARILDHSTLCPVCRRSLPLPASLSDQLSNKYLVDLLNALCPDQVTARAEAADLEERSAPGGLDTPLFLVAVTFPQMPLLLHVFEPRYRLLIRRAIQGNGQFGIIAHNFHGRPQGHLGRTQFMQYGVMVRVEHYQVLDDGRSFLQCRGIHRFTVLAHGVLDGYAMARVQKVEDISLAEEERLEMAETSRESATPNDANEHLDRLSTQQLLDIGMNFIQRAGQSSATWLHGRIIEVYGGPPTDPALFPYWFASVVPIDEKEKYTLLPTTSVRERLKITARWVHMIERSRW